MTQQMRSMKEIREFVKRHERRRKRINYTAAIGVPILVLGGVAWYIADQVRSIHREGAEKRAEWSQRHEAREEEIQLEAQEFYKKLKEEAEKHKHVDLGYYPKALETITLESNPHYDFEVLHRDTLGRDHTRKYRINGIEIRMAALGGDDFFETDEDGSVKGQVKVSYEYPEGFRSDAWFRPKKGKITHVAEASNGKRLEVIVHNVNPVTGEFSYSLVRSALVR